MEKIKTLVEDGYSERWGIMTHLSDKIDELVKAVNNLNVVVKICLDRINILKKILEENKDGKVNS